MSLDHFVGVCVGDRSRFADADANADDEEDRFAARFAVYDPGEQRDQHTRLFAKKGVRVSTIVR